MGRPPSFNSGLNVSVILLCIIKMTLSTALFFVINIVWGMSLQQDCYPLWPLPGPELYYEQDVDNDICSVVVDWSRYINTCEGETFSGYEVKYMNSCTNEIISINLTDESESMYANRIKISGANCSESADSRCYHLHRAKLRARLGNSSWSLYSAWTTLSTSFKTVQGNSSGSGSIFDA